MTDDRTHLLGQAGIGGLLFEYSLPAIVGMLAQACYNFIDRVFVGQALGASGIAGVTVSFPYMLVVMAFGMLIGIGATAIISIRLGQRNKPEAERALGNAALLLVLASVATTVLGLAYLDPILRIFGASPEVLPYARDYLRIIAAGSVFQVVGFGLNAAIRGAGRPKTAMFSMLISVAVNAALAPLFIFSFGWGMAGAAWATVIAQAVSMVWVLAHFLTGRTDLVLRASCLWPDMRLWREIFVIGSPHFAMQFAGSVIQSVLNHQLYAYGGDLAISVMGVLYVVFMMIGMPIFGINQGAQPIIGYNYGARKLHRVKRALLLAITAATVITTLGFAVSMLFPVQVIRLFHRHDEALLTLGVHAMRVCTLMMPVVGFQIVSASYFQAVGKPREALLLMLSRQVLMLIPAMLILPHYFGLNGVWAALPCADGCSSIASGLWLWFELRRLDVA